MRIFKIISSQQFWQNNFFPDVEECKCSSTSGIFITKKQASYFCSIIVFLFLFIFVAGYFLGKKSAIDEFSKNMLNGSFADQARYSFYSLFGNPENDETEESEPEEQEITEEPKIDNILSNQKFSAELIGFTSKNSAENFVKKMEKMGYNTFIKERKSVTSKNRLAKTWYQVVTDDFDDQSKLLDLVDKVKFSQRLGDVKIISKQS